MLLHIERLKKFFPVKQNLFSAKKVFVRAVDGVSLSIDRNEVLGLVGESGCGKSTVGRCILRLIDPTEGKICFDGQDILLLKGNKLKTIRRNMQIIFQDPMSSLNPRMTVGSIIREPLIIHGIGTAKEQDSRFLSILDLVGLPANVVNRYPHEFSGGQRQRIGIARALALNPKLIIADEPVSALDVSIQAQIINLLAELKKELGLSYLFISHDLSVVRHISDRIAVMYLGKIVETGPADDICFKPMHPYTKALLSVVPEPVIKNDKKRMILAGDVPSPSNPPSGCAFHTRCPGVRDECKVNVPALEKKENGRLVRCPYAE